MNKIVASGPVIIEKNKLLLTMNDGDSFYKIPGGKVEERESFEECAIRELEEETGFIGIIIKKLPTMKLKKDPDNDDIINVELYHFLAKLKNKVSNYDSFEHNGHTVRWIDIEDIKNNKFVVAPNVKFLIDKGEIV
jgi:ADP-ribose pyrophosphatase YjhB (NUDIX family)